MFEYTGKPEIQMLSSSTTTERAIYSDISIPVNYSVIPKLVNLSRMLSRLQSFKMVRSKFNLVS